MDDFGTRFDAVVEKVRFTFQDPISKLHILFDRWRFGGLQFARGPTALEVDQVPKVSCPFKIV